MNTKEIFVELLELYQKYTAMHRRTIAFDKYQELVRLKPEAAVQTPVDDPIFQESLLEHVGCVPMIAAFLYPYQKTQEFLNAEHNAALQLLPEQYHDLFNEYDARETLDAKFTKSVDVFSTFLADQLLPRELVQQRLQAHGFSWLIVGEKRYEIFIWDAFLRELFDEVIERYQIIEG